jgi:hypothetical protein
MDVFTERLITRMGVSITHLNVLTKRYSTLYTSYADRSAVQTVLLHNLTYLYGNSPFHLRVYL